jgi:hypothetical protein
VASSKATDIPTRRALIPCAPRLDPLRAALARLDAAEAAKDLKADQSEAERKASLNETAPPPAKAPKRARR